MCCLESTPILLAMGSHFRLRVPSDRMGWEGLIRTEQASFSTSQGFQMCALLQGVGGYFSKSIHSHRWVVLKLLCIYMGECPTMSECAPFLSWNQRVSMGQVQSCTHQGEERNIRQGATH